MHNYEPWQEKVHKAEQSHWWFKARRAIVSSVFLKSILKKESLRILSVGVGAGTELAYLSRCGVVEGLEIDEAHVKIGREKGFTIHHQDITQCTLPSETYDVIFAMDVLEHIEDHEKAYQEIRRLLKKDGKLIVTVPAFQFLWSKSDELNYHKRRYNKSQLRHLLKDDFMKFELLSYYNFFLFPILLLRRLFFPKSGEGEIKTPIAPLNKLLYFIFQGEKYFLKYVSFPWGGSLIAILAKK